MRAGSRPARLQGAGTAAEIGPGVEGFQVGDVVSVILAFSLNDHGLYTHLASTPARAVVKHPASVSCEKTASTVFRLRPDRPAKELRSNPCIRD